MLLLRQNKSGVWSRRFLIRFPLTRQASWVVMVLECKSSMKVSTSAQRSVFLHSLVCIQLSKLAEIGEIIPDALELLTGNIAVSVCVEILEDRLQPWKQDWLFARNVNGHAFTVRWWFDSIWFYAFFGKDKKKEGMSKTTCSWNTSASTWHRTYSKLPNGGDF